MHWALETRWQRFGQFLHDFLNDFLNYYLYENLNDFLHENLNLNFFMKILDVLYAKSS